MKGFVWMGDYNGHKNPIITKLPVADGTAIEKGEPVIFTPGTGVESVPSPAGGFDVSVAGVCMQEKVASDGVTMIEVSTSPSAYYKHKETTEYTLNNGSATTAVVTALNDTDVENIFKEGAIRITKCQNDSTLVGKVVRITASSQSDGELTLAETLPVELKEDDKIQLVPGVYAKNSIEFSLNSDAMAPNYADADADNVQFVGSNVNTLESYWRFKRHDLGTEDVS